MAKRLLLVDGVERKAPPREVTWLTRIGAGRIAGAPSSPQPTATTINETSQNLANRIALPPDEFDYRTSYEGLVEAVKPRPRILGRQASPGAAKPL